ARNAEIPRLMHGPDAVVLLREAVGDLARPIAAPVIDDDHLVVRERSLRCPDDVADRGLQIRRLVVRRHEHADAVKARLLSKARRRRLGHPWYHAGSTTSFARGRDMPARW